MPITQQPAGAATNTASVMTLEQLEERRQAARKSDDPEEQFDFAKLLISLAHNGGVAGGSLDDGSRSSKVSRNDSEALLAEGLKSIKRLALQGVGKYASRDAQFFLANAYGNGLCGLPVDHDKSFNLYVQASKQNHPAAAYRTAVCCEIGAGTKRDYGRAMQFYRKAATLGDVSAMYKMGMILLNGLLNQQKNAREAISWLKHAAAKADEANPHALHQLGLCYEKSGIPSVIPDEAYARDLFLRAAQLGYVPSQFKMGHCYEHGELQCPVDPHRSIAWYTRAAEQGDPDSELALSGWYLTGVEGLLRQSDTEAYLWARKAADQGFAKAEYAVGYYSEMGIGVRQDLEEARRWYMRAASQGNKSAMQRINEIKRLGTGQKRQDRSRKTSDGCTIM